MKKKEFIGIGCVLAVGLLTALPIVFSGKGTSGSGRGDQHGCSSHGQDHAGHAHVGAQGGKPLKEGSFQLEVLIYEKGVPPHFRVYCTENGKPVDPQQVKVTMEVKRLGDRLTVFNLVPDKEFLFSREVVDEPHSFEVIVTAEYRGETYDWEYWKIEGRVELTDELIVKMGVETQQAVGGTIKSLLEMPGEIVFDADRLAHVIPRVPGVAVQALKNLGDSVRAGEVIAVIDSRELGDARSKYLVAVEREKLALYNFERARRLWEKETVPEKEFLTAQKAYLEERIEMNSAFRKLVTMGLSEDEIRSLSDHSRDSLTHYPIRAAFDGVVVKKHLSPGEWVKEDTEIYLIADLSSIWVDVTVYAHDLNSVRIGQKAVVKANSSGPTAEGQVSYVGPVMGEESRTAKARVVLPNPGGQWRPGLFVKVELVGEEASVPVMVRNDGVQSFRNRDVVFVRYGDEFEVRPVTLGRKDDRHVEVVKGLDAGENYVVRNSFVLKAELGKAGMSHQH